MRLLAWRGDERVLDAGRGRGLMMITAATHLTTDRAQALGEIARVLRPGGQLLIEDIRHPDEYMAALAAHGCVVTRRIDSRIVFWIAKTLSRGKLEPVTILARKSAG